MRRSLRRRSLRLAALASAAAVAAFISPCPLVAATETVALTAQPAPGPPVGLRFNAFSSPTLDASGRLFFEASLQTGFGGVTSTTDEAHFYGIPGALSLLTREGSPAPGTPVGAVFDSLGFTRQSTSGPVTFAAALRIGTGGVTVANDFGLWTTPTPALAGATRLLAREAAAAPGAGPGVLFSSFVGPAVVNGSGRTLFSALLEGTGVSAANDSSVWATPAAGDPPALIAREGTQAPGLPAGALFGDLTALTAPAVLTSTGQTAFFATLQTGTGGVTTSNNAGLWAGDATSGGLVLVARKGSQAPDAPAGALFQISGLGLPSLASTGQLAFGGSMVVGTGGVTADNADALWAGRYDDLQLIARQGFQAPQAPAGALFESFGHPIVNASGQVVFDAALQHGPGVGPSNDRAIWAGSPTSLRLIAREGSQVPGAPAGAVFRSVSDSTINAAGHVAFTGLLQHGPGGVDLSNERGLWVSDLAGQALPVVRTGQSLAGKTVLNFTYSYLINSAADDNATGLNNFGQVAYSAVFTDGAQGVFLFTPDLHWRTAGNGSWDTRTNWTLSTDPAHVHPVTIDPAASLTVTGPLADTTVKSLIVGGGAGIATLRLQAGATLHVVDGSAFIDTTGILTGDGTLSAGSPFSSGHIIAENLTLTDALENEGRITPNPAPNSTGRLNGTVFNLAPGLVRVAAGQRLVMTSLGNEGRVELHGAPASPAELELTTTSSNLSGGVISLRDATLRLGAPLTNAGVLSVSFGAADVVGPLTNAASGQVLVSSAQAAFHGPVSNAAPAAKVIVTAGASATFYGPVTNSVGSEFRVSQGATATFFAPVTGSNFFTGLGTVNFEAGASAVGPLSVGSAGIAPLASLDTNAFNVSSLTVGGRMRVLPGSAASRTSALAILASGSADLTDNDLVIDGGDLAATVSHITSGRLFSSAAGRITGLAAVKNDSGGGTPIMTTFSSLPVDNDDVLVKYTYRGDADLDGRVSIADYFAADRGRALRLSGWQNGDSDYSGGFASADDYTLIDRSFLAQGQPFGAAIAPPALSAAALVPEPAVMLAVLFFSAFIQSRRRRRR